MPKVKLETKKFTIHIDGDNLHGIKLINEYKKLESQVAQEQKKADRAEKKTLEIKKELVQTKRGLTQALGDAKSRVFYLNKYNDLRLSFARYKNWHRLNKRAGLLEERLYKIQTKYEEICKNVENLPKQISSLGSLSKEIKILGNVLKEVSKADKEFKDGTRQPKLTEKKTRVRKKKARRRF